MSTTKYPYGKPVKLQVDLQGYPDGRLMRFEIWKKEGSKEEKIAEVNGAIRGGKGFGDWNPQSKGNIEILPLVQKVQGNVSAVTYYFVAKIDDEETKSKDFEFVYDVEMQVVDANEKALDGVEYTVTLSDGTKVKGETQNGRIKIAQAPFGKFQIELEGYDFVFS